MVITETVYVFVALVTQHTMRCPALQHFSTLFHKRHDFRTNVNGFFFIYYFFFSMPHMSLTDFVVFPPGHRRSVTDF